MAENILAIGEGAWRYGFFCACITAARSVGLRGLVIVGGLRYTGWGEGFMQIVIAGVILGLAVLVSAVILYRAFRSKDALASEKISWVGTAVSEILVFFFASFGVSDFLLNTLLLRFSKLDRTEYFPGTLIASGVMPGAVMSFTLLKSNASVDFVTLLVCCAGIILGYAIGGRLVKRLDGKRLKKLIALLLVLSLVALIVKMFISSEVSGNKSGLEGGMLLLAAAFACFVGVVNSFGVPMKPACIAFFLIAGLTPISALTLMLTIGCIGPISGSVAVLKEKRYYQKLAVSAVIFGTVGAILGGLCTIAINQFALGLVMVLVILVAIVSMLF